MKNQIEGKKILITRDLRQSKDLVKTLSEFGAECILFPTLKIVPVTDWCDRLSDANTILGYDWIIFSSVNGVKYFLKSYNLLKSSFKGSIAVVGPKTHEFLKAQNIRADVVPAAFSAKGILDALNAFDLKEKRILLPTSDIARMELSDGLTKKGAQVTRLVVYKTQCENEAGTCETLKRIKNKNPDIALFYSPSAFECFCHIAGTSLVKEMAKRTALIAIGPTTAAAIERSGFKTALIPEQSTQESLIQSLQNFNNEKQMRRN